MQTMDKVYELKDILHVELIHYHPYESDWSFYNIFMTENLTHNYMLEVYTGADSKYYFSKSIESLVDMISEDCADAFKDLQNSPKMKKEESNNFSLECSNDKHKITIEAKNQYTFQNIIDSLDKKTVGKYIVNPEFPIGSKLKTRWGTFCVEKADLVKSTEKENMYEYEYHLKSDKGETMIATESKLSDCIQRNN